MHVELEQRLSFCGNLPTLPAVALRIIELANNPEVHLNDVARVIAMDPALVTKLFRVANSPLYGVRRKATNLRQVLNLLGLQGTLALALGFSLMASSRGINGIPLDTEQFWRRSLLAATACRTLGERLGLKNLEELFLAGLLHGIGILALAIMMPDQYATLLDESGDRQLDGSAVLDVERLARLERVRLQVDHTQVGSWLLNRWGLPDYLCHAVAGSLDPSDPLVPEPHRSLVECVALSVRLADIWVRPGYWQNSPQIAELARQWFGLAAQDYVELLGSVGAKLPEMAELFQIKTLDATEIAGILDQAREALTVRNRQEMAALASGGHPPGTGVAAVAAADFLAERPVTVIGSSPPAGLHPQLPLDDEYVFDSLTGLFNRAYFEDILRRELTTAKAQNWPLTLVLVDLDHCTQINETRGQAVGDQVLIVLCRLFGANIRRHDTVARHGGDEFALLLPASGAEPGRHLLARLQELARQWEPTLGGENSLHITFCAGLATYPDSGFAESITAEELLQAAEEALAAAKRAGPDQLFVYGQ
ncbi:MAG TPA: GGDEF domain-containing protein [Candidatus Competibacter sp.]|nr:GGDEF domain-containing protein [Candidatus Competibacter sp.]